MTNTTRQFIHQIEKMIVAVNFYQSNQVFVKELVEVDATLDSLKLAIERCKTMCQDRV